MEVVVVNNNEYIRMKRYEIAYDMALILVTLTFSLILAHGIVNKIGVGAIALVILTISVYLYNDKELKSCKYLCWLGMLGFGIIAIFVAIGLEPIWGQFAVLLIQGRHNEALQVLNSKPHANIILLLGLCSIYASIFGIIRIFFINVMQHLTNTGHGKS